MDQLPRLGKRDLIRPLLFTCNSVVSVRRGFLFVWVLGMGYIILLWHFLSLPYNYLDGHVNVCRFCNSFVLSYTIYTEIVKLNYFYFCIMNETSRLNLNT